MGQSGFMKKPLYAYSMRVTKLYMCTKFRMCVYSEIREFNQKKKKMNNSGTSYIHFNPFPIVEMYPFLIRASFWWYGHNDVNRSSNDY